MTDPRTRIVADGYDAMGETFAAWREEIVGDPRRAWEDELVSRLEPGSRVLDLGCGGGTAETKRLAQRFRVTGVDISPRQVERARSAIPEAEFVCSDVTELELPPGSFDAVASFYAFNHFGASDLEGWTGEWLGAQTFFSGFSPEINSRLVRAAGFTIERDEVVEFEEPDGPARFQWVLAHT